MTIHIYRGEPGSKCSTCGSAERPNLVLFTVGDGGEDTTVCVHCIVRWVDVATGWRMASNVLQALAVGDAGERFHHPERFVPRRVRQSREQQQNRRWRRVYLDGDLLSSEGGTTAGES